MMNWGRTQNTIILLKKNDQTIMVWSGIVSSAKIPFVRLASFKKYITFIYMQNTKGTTTHHETT